MGIGTDFYDPFNENKPIGGLKGLGNALGSIFGNIFKPSQSMPISGSMRGGGPASSSYYQITPEDTGLDSVANNTGVSLPDLVAANGGARTLPPVGSYIQTQAQTVGGDMGSLLASQQAGAQSQNAVLGGGDSYKDARQVSPGAQLAVSRENVNTSFNNFNEMYRLTGQMDTSLLPTSINLSTLKALEAKGFFPSVDGAGNPLTPAQAMQQYGYEFKDGKFVQTGTPGAAQNDKPKLGTRAGQVMDNKFVLVNKGGRLVWMNMKRQDKQKFVSKAGPAANAAATQESVLNLNIGSG